MSWFSDLFKSKKVETQPDKESWQLSAGKAVSDWAQKYLNTYVPGKEYTGSFTAPMASGEKAGQEWLMKYLNQPDTGRGFELASGELEKTLTGGYNPYTSPEYAAFKKGANLDLEEAITSARRSQGARGTYFQDTGIREESKLRERTLNYLDQLLAGMSERERERKLQAVPMAMSLEEYAQGVPFKKATAGMTLGSLPRLIEQGELEARYKDFVRKQEELSGTVTAAQGAFATPINYGVRSYETSSPFERIMSSLAPVVGAVAGSTGSFNPAAWFSATPAMSMAGGGK